MGWLLSWEANTPPYSARWDDEIVFFLLVSWLKLIHYWAAPQESLISWHDTTTMIKLIKRIERSGRLSLTFECNATEKTSNVHIISTPLQSSLSAVSSHVHPFRKRPLRTWNLESSWKSMIVRWELLQCWINRWELRTFKLANSVRFEIKINPSNCAKKSSTKLIKCIEVTNSSRILFFKYNERLLNQLISVIDFWCVIISFNYRVYSTPPQIFRLSLVPFRPSSSS